MAAECHYGTRGVHLCLGRRPAAPQGKNISDLASQGVPRRVVLDAPVVTADNVDQYIDSAFES